VPSVPPRYPIAVVRMRVAERPYKASDIRMGLVGCCPEIHHRLLCDRLGRILACGLSATESSQTSRIILRRASPRASSGCGCADRSASLAERSNVEDAVSGGDPFVGSSLTDANYADLPSASRTAEI
jgi:hypothetical protein